MRTLVHLSDLHFGRIDAALARPLAETVSRIRPDVVAVSGDLTQRAKIREFHEARAFLDSLPSPQIIVPGNHDVPLYDVFGRFFERLNRFRTYISAELEPFYADEEIAIAGVNTARSLAFKGGRINMQQVQHIRETLCAFPEEVTKIIVTHHPFDLPAGHPAGSLVGRAEMAMRALAYCGADVFLSGHLHLGRTTHTAVRYRISGLSALIVQAGTATSTRGRGEPNSFNILRIEHPSIVVDRLNWDSRSGGFSLLSTERFEHTAEGWART